MQKGLGMGVEKLVHNELTDQIISAAIEVHRALGPGLLESVYERCMCHELGLRDIENVCQLHVPIDYKGVTLDGGLRLDLLVQDTVIVEIKAVDALTSVHEAQLLTYMKLMDKCVGLLMNFNAPKLRDGLIRRVL